MANPQKENGYTPIANEILHALMACKLLNYEVRVVICVIRKTYGWNKKIDWVSNSQISEETGLARSNVTRTVKGLLDRKILFKDGKKIGLQKDWEKWRVEWYVDKKVISRDNTVISPDVDKKVISRDNTVISPDNKKLSHQIPTKEKKETIQKREKKKFSHPVNNLKENMSNWNKEGDDLDQDKVVDYDGDGTVKSVEDKVENKKDKGFRASDIVELWNKYPTFEALATEKKIKGKPRNPTTITQLLPKARGTKDELLAIGVCMKRYGLEDFEHGIDNYIRELINRDSKDNWAGKRYSLYDLMKNKGYNFKTYVNR